MINKKEKLESYDKQLTEISQTQSDKKIDLNSNG